MPPIEMLGLREGGVGAMYVWNLILQPSIDNTDDNTIGCKLNQASGTVLNCTK